MARVTGPVRQLARHLHPHEPLVEERSARPGLRASAARADRVHRARGHVDGEHHREGASRRDGSAEKRTVPKPSGAPAAAGPPRFIRVPRMLEPPSRSPSRRDRPTTPRKGANCRVALVGSTAVPRCSWTAHNGGKPLRVGRGLRAVQRRRRPLRRLRPRTGRLVPPTHDARRLLHSVCRGPAASPTASGTRSGSRTSLSDPGWPEIDYLEP